MSEPAQSRLSNGDRGEGQGNSDQPAVEDNGSEQKAKSQGLSAFFGKQADIDAEERGVIDLIRAVADAGVMLRYAAQQGFDLEIEREPINIAIVVEVKYLLKKRPIEISHAQETDFWKAYQQLSKLIRPVTIESIRAILDTERELKKKPKVSKARRAVRRYQQMSLIVLLILIGLQFYTAFGTTVITGIKKTEENISNYKVEKKVLESELAALEEKQKEEIDPKEEPRIRGALAGLEDKKEHWNYERDSQYMLLTAWDSFNFITRIRLPSFKQEANDSKIGKLLAKAKSSEKQSLPERYQMLQAGSITLEALSVFILPLIYDLLGACAFVLRTLTIEIRDYT